MKPLHCPNCKCRTGYTHRQAVRGVWKTEVYADGHTDGTEALHGIIHGPEPKTVKCHECEKRVPNPNLPKEAT